MKCFKALRTALGISFSDLSKSLRITHFFILFSRVRPRFLLFTLYKFELHHTYKVCFYKTKINLKVHYCRFENLPVCSYSYKNTTLKISHS